MALVDDTLDQTWSRFADDPSLSGPPQPGIVKVFVGGRPTFDAAALSRFPATLGRGEGCHVVIDDARISRRHAEISFGEGLWLVRDLDSRNGTFLDGDSQKRSCAGERGGVLGLGDSLLLLCPDVRPYLDGSVEIRGDIVIGPRLRPAWREVARAARSGERLHIRGETGTGKELCARLFHDSGPHARGPFVAVNCATIPPLLAERLLFGARRGAFSGAHTDAEGYLCAAEGGTLFLDEVAELPMEVQAKLLRAIDVREVLALGATRAQRIDVQICSATHRDLRAHVAQGKFREDLYFRLARPAVDLPPLRQRPDEIPWIIQGALQRLRPARLAHPSLVEAALLRPWPGNIRELGTEVAAAADCLAGEDRRVMARDLAPSAGLALSPSAPPESKAAVQVEGGRAILEALRSEQGNVSRAARVLGLHRTQLRRWLARHGVDPRQFAPADRPEGDEG